MINLLEMVLRAPRTVITLMIVLVAAGVAAYIAVPKEANPDIDVPVFYVSLGQQGISSKDSETLLVKPMETSLRSLDGLKEITAVSYEGGAGIILEFEVGFDKDKVLADVRDKVDQAKADLPDAADEPSVSETNLSLEPTIIVTLSGNVPERTLFKHARFLQDEIEAISTVLEAELSGQRDELLEVIIDTLRMESYGVTQDEVFRALTANNQLIAAGFLDNGQGRFNVKMPGLVASPEDVYSIPIKRSGDGLVTVGDIAEIKRTFKDPSRFTRVNGRPAISLNVKKRIGTNIIANNDSVKQIVEEATKDWPDTIKVNFILDQSGFIFEVLGSLQSSILTAIILVMTVVLLALGPRSALLVGLSIPTSFMVGFFIVSMIGMTLNMMVMFGLVLTVGLLVDGAIVVVEYADRKIAEGMKRREAFIRSARMMFWPIVSSTGTTLAAFLPMLLWPGVPGEFMSYLPIMVIIVLSASLLSALVFLPVSGGLIGRAPASAEEARRAQQIGGTSEFDYRKIRGLNGLYIRFLRLLATNPLGNLVALAIVVTVPMMIFYSFQANNAGVEFFVEEEPDNAIIFISARGNLSSREALELTKEVEREVLSVSGIENAVMTSYANGGGGGGVSVSVPDKPADLIGEISLDLENYCCRRKAAEIFGEIRTKTADISGLKVEVRQIEGGPPQGKDIQLEIKSTSYDDVANTVAAIRPFFDQFEGLIDIEDTRPLPGIDWELIVDREEAGRFGTNIASIGAMVQLVTNGFLVDTYRPDDSEDEIDIRVRVPEQYRNLDELSNLRVMTSLGFVPITNFVELRPKQKISNITRRDGLYAMDIKAGVDQGAGFDVNERRETLMKWVAEQEWPSTVRFALRGGNEDQEESSAFLAQAMLASLFLMFIILVTQFNSFYQSALTLLTIVLSVFGVLLGMIITGQKFSVIMTGTGILALAGIVVNNAIVLIDTYNRFLREGVDPIEAVLRTSAQRVRPILLTTITTICGLIPMATQINFDFINQVTNIGGITAIWWVQLATAVIFGLGFSTILTLVMIPVALAAPFVWYRLPGQIEQFFYGSWTKRKVSTQPRLPASANDSDDHGSKDIPDHLRINREAAE